MGAAVANATGRSIGHRLLEVGGIATFWAVLAELSLRVERFADGTWEWGVTALGALLGYPFADFMSGFVHWVGDTLGDESTPVVGSNFIGPFREHHVDPKGITRHGFLETNGNNSLVSLPFLAAIWFAFPEPGYVGLFVIAFVGSGAVFTFGTNQFHKWAHEDDPPAIARALQRWGLILGPDHHDIHHTDPYDRYYCITTGWMNAPLERIGFFRRCEALVRRWKPDLLYRERGKAR